MDTYAGKSHRDLKGGLTESSTANTSVEAKTFGQHRGSIKVGADFVLTKDFMFNLNAEYGLATYGDENFYAVGLDGNSKLYKFTLIFKTFDLY